MFFYFILCFKKNKKNRFETTKLIFFSRAEVQEAEERPPSEFDHLTTTELRQILARQSGYKRLRGNRSYLEQQLRDKGFGNWGGERVRGVERARGGMKWEGEWEWRTFYLDSY
jgi:hypothetical protein